MKQTCRNPTESILLVASTYSVRGTNHPVKYPHIENVNPRRKKKSDAEKMAYPTNSPTAMTATGNENVKLSEYV